MSIPEDSKFNTGLIISKYSSKDIVPLLPLLAIEFPDWSLKKIKSYIDIVIEGKNDVSGILVAKNEALYNVGLLVYTFQQIQNKQISKTNGENLSKCLVVENLVASSPVLQKMVFLLLIEEVIDIAKKHNCELIELPKLDDAYQFVNDKFNGSVIDSSNFRTFLDLNKISIPKKSL